MKQEKDYYFRTILQKYHALITINEAKLLYNLARKSNGPIVEIGSYKGGSTIILAEGSKIENRNKVYAIDPHKGTLFYGIRVKRWGAEKVNKNTLSKFKQNIIDSANQDIVQPIVKSSYKASKKWKKSIDLLWIDGCHDYESVMIDFLAWERFLNKNGIIAFHDYQNSEINIPSVGENIPRLEGPIKTVNYMKKTNRYTIIGIIDSTIYAKKIKNSIFRDNIKNILLIKWLSFIHKSKILFRVFFPKMYFFIDNIINKNKSHEFKEQKR